MTSSPASRLPSLVLLLLAGLTVVLIACDSTAPTEESISPDVLDSGDSWTYDVLFTRSPVDSTVVDTVLTTTIRMRVTSTDTRIGNRFGLIEVETFNVSTPDSTERTWYQQSPDSLVDVAYTTPFSVSGTVTLSKSAMPPQSRDFTRGIAGLPVLVRHHVPSSPASKTIPDTTIRDDSRIVLRTPFEEGASWTSFRSPFLSRRFVRGRSTVETRAGQFETVEIATTLPDQAPSLRWTDFIAQEGLVKRVLTDTLERRNEEGISMGQYVSREVYELQERQ